MNTLANLKSERTSLIEKSRKILDGNPGRLTAADKTALQKFQVRLDTLTTVIDRNERVRDIVIDDHLFSDKNSLDHGQDMFNKFVRKGFSAGEWLKVQNTMSTTTPSEGGYSVPANVAREVVTAMKDFSGMRSAATVISTETGNDLAYPTSDGTAEVGEIIVQNAPATDLDVSFGTKLLPVFKYSSKIVTIPFELLQDANIDVESYVKERFSERLGRAQNIHFTTGTGSAQPTGIINVATSGKVGTGGQTTSVTYDDLIDLEMAVDPAYRRKAKFMMNDATLKAVKKLKDAQGAPIWTPSIRTDGVAVIDGFESVINNDMANMGANAKSILFGDFSKFIVRDVLQMNLFRLDDSFYAKKAQVGFLAFLRSGGNLTDVNAVKYYQNSAT